MGDGEATGDGEAAGEKLCIKILVGFVHIRLMRI